MNVFGHGLIIDDINSYTKGISTVEPTAVFKGHNSVVEVCAILHVCKQVTDKFIERTWIGLLPKKTYLPVEDDKMP
jgi:hypothetical protein